MTKFTNTFARRIINRVGPRVGKGQELARKAFIQSQLLELPRGIRILDAGAGELQYKEYCSHLNYVSQDFCQYNGDTISEGLQISGWDTNGIDIISDITAIPEPDESFDCILCSEVLEHIPEPIKAIKEFSRLLKSGGTLILTAPFSSLTHMAPYYFYSGFSRYFYERVMKDNGFCIQKIEFNGSYFDYLAAELRRLASISERYSKSGFLSDLFMVVLSCCTLRLLNRLRQRDSDSREILCWSLFTVAIRD